MDSIIPFLDASSTLREEAYQIKHRASEALPELLYPVRPITSFEGMQAHDPSHIFGLASNMEQLKMDDWEF